MQTKASDFLSDAHDIVVARKVELNMSAGIRNANPAKNLRVGAKPQQHNGVVRKVGIVVGGRGN